MDGLFVTTRIYGIRELWNITLPVQAIVVYRVSCMQRADQLPIFINVVDTDLTVVFIPGRPSCSQHKGVSFRCTKNAVTAEVGRVRWWFARRINLVIYNMQFGGVGRLFAVLVHEERGGDKAAIVRYIQVRV